jgi:hypothetical protein
MSDNIMELRRVRIGQFAQELSKKDLNSSIQLHHYIFHLLVLYLGFLRIYLNQRLHHREKLKTPEPKSHYWIVQDTDLKD